MNTINKLKFKEEKMKKRIVSLSLVILVILSLIPNISQAEEGVKLWVNGNFVETDVAPFIENGRTLVPIRVISENLGIEVKWSNEEKSVMTYQLINGVPNFDDSLLLKIGDKQVAIPPSKAAEKNALYYELDVAPQIVNNRTFVPLRFIAEAYGLSVNWDPVNRTVIVGEGYVATKAPVTEPIPVVTPTPNPNPSPSENTPITGSYIGNKNSKIFHYSGCDSVAKMSPKNKVSIENRDSAIKSGYKPCQRCHP